MSDIALETGVESTEDAGRKIEKSINDMDERELRHHCRSMEMICELQDDDIKILKRENERLYKKLDENRTDESYIEWQLSNAMRMMDIPVIDSYTLRDKARIIRQHLDDLEELDKSRDIAVFRVTVSLGILGCAFLVILLIAMIASVVA